MEIQFRADTMSELVGLRADVVALTCFADERPLRGTLGLIDWRVAGALSGLCQGGFITGELGETALLSGLMGLPCERLFLFGAGTRQGFDTAALGLVTDRILRTLGGAGVSSWVGNIPGIHITELDAEEAALIFFRRLLASEESGEVVLLDRPDSQKRLQPVLEREERRARAPTDF